jgi:Putative Ig domain
MKRALLFGFLLLVSSAAYGQCLLTFQTESAGPFIVGQPANFQFEAVSGTEPYKFEIVEGALPEGLHFTGSGKIVGKPREANADLPPVIFIRVTDAAGCTLTQAFQIAVFP